MSAVRRYRRHVELYGSECVYEAAAGDGFDPIELGQLALALRTVDRRWRLDRDQRADLLHRLEGRGLDDKTLRRYLGIGQDTLRRMRQGASQSGESTAESPEWQSGPHTPVLRQEAA